MSALVKRSGLVWTVAAAFTLLLAWTVAAQTPKGEGVKEESIYIPYKKLREVFEKEGRVVFMPYDKFLELWKDRIDRTPGPEVVKPPVDSLISEITNAATVSKDVVTVSSVVKIEVLKEGWTEVPLRLTDAAITKATVDGAPARILFDKAAGYKLLVEKKGAQAQSYTLTLEFAKAFTKAPGQNSVSFETPQAPVSRWEVRVPEAGVKVNIQPLLAATEVPPVAKAEETVVLAFVGAAPVVRIDWTPKAEGAKGLTALSSVTTETQMEIEEGVTRTRTKLAYSISRAELTNLVIEVPADQKVVNVFDPNVREWTVETSGATQKITVQLFEPAKETQNLTVELQKFVADATQQIDAPVVKAVGVGRQQGVVVVRVADTLRSEAVKRTGLLQVDASELPTGLANSRWHYSYRYAALPFELVLSIEKIKPHIEVDSLVEGHLTPEDLTIDMLAVYDIERAGVFRLDLEIPEGYDVRFVRGYAIANGIAAVVDTHHLEGEKKTSLVVNLTRKAIGRVGLEIELNRKLHEADLLSPTGKSAVVALAIPRVSATGVDRQSGRIVVAAPESLRINPIETKGLRSISFAEAAAGMRSIENTSAERAVLAFAFTEEPVTLTLAAERRMPQVTARQLLIARVDTGVVKYDVTLFYDILYSGVKSLRLDVPADLAKEIRITTPGVQYQAMDESEADNLTKGYVAWKLTGETEFMGSVKIALNWERKLEKLDIGKSVDIEIPKLKPVVKANDRAWGQIVLMKAETVDVRPTTMSESLRGIDPQHDLMPGASAPTAARAFEFHEDWQLTVTATQYKLQEVKRTSIERALVRMVVTRGGETSVQAVYNMRSQQQRLYIQLPAGTKFDTEPLRINGRPVSLEQGDEQKNIYSVPLVGQAADQAFLLELRYRVTRGGLGLECPSFPEDAADADAKEDPAVQKVYLSVYLPEELAYVGSIGAWTDEMTWYLGRGLYVTPVANRDKDWLVGWVAEAMNSDVSHLQNFELDGHHYLFSTLRPLPAPAGSLRVVALNGKLLSGIVIAVIVLGGLALLRWGFAVKCFAAGAFIVTLVLLAVFFPTLIRQIVNGSMAGSVVIVLVAWAIGWIVKWTWRRSKRTEGRAPTGGAPPATPPAPTGSADSSSANVEGPANA